MAVYEIPTGPSARHFPITLYGYPVNLRFYYLDAPMGGWAMDLADANNSPLCCGLRLVPGVDLLEPYQYLGIPGRIFVVTPGDMASEPTFEGLGTDSHVYYEEPTS